MARIILALLALMGLMWFFSRLGRLTGAERNAFVIRAALYALVGVVLLLVVSGRAPALFAAVAAVIPWLQRAALLRRLGQTLGGFGIQIPGLDRMFGRNFAGGKLLRLSRDQRSGRISGDVLAGSFAGRALDDLTLPELRRLHTEVLHNDPDALDSFETYLDQGFDGWRNQSGGGLSTTMSRAEALEVLDLEEGASEADVVDAHRRLISRLHPDRGGNNYLAVKVNQAKDTLLGSRSA